MSIKVAITGTIRTDRPEYSSPLHCTNMFVLGDDGFGYETMIFPDAIVDKVTDFHYVMEFDGEIYHILVLPGDIRALDTDYCGVDIPVHDIPKGSATGNMLFGFNLGDEVFEPEIEVEGMMIGKFTQGARKGQIGLLAL